MTGQSLLDRMELVNQELQMQPGEADVTRGLVALNVAQDYFESLAAGRGKVFGSSTGTISTAANVETTAFPAGLLRIDRLQRLGTNNLPTVELSPIRRAGGHAASWAWPLNILANLSPGEPYGYWSNGTSIYWTPLPDAIYTIRWYGFQAATDITASGTFLYPDVCAMPIAAFAASLMKVGVDDPATDAGSLAQTIFEPVLDALGNFNRDGASGLEYTQIHEA